MEQSQPASVMERVTAALAKAESGEKVYVDRADLEAVLGFADVGLDRIRQDIGRGTGLRNAMQRIS